MKEKAFKITFWVDPTKYAPGRIEKRKFFAKSRTEAEWDAKDRFPTWSVIEVEEDTKGTLKSL